MNPAGMMKMMTAINTFKVNHPKFFSFIDTVIKPGIPADTVVEITVTKPGQEPVTTNIKIRETDLELFESLKDGIR